MPFGLHFSFFFAFWGFKVMKETLSKYSVKPEEISTFWHLGRPKGIQKGAKRRSNNDVDFSIDSYVDFVRFLEPKGLPKNTDSGPGALPRASQDAFQTLPRPTLVYETIWARCSTDLNINLHAFPMMFRTLGHGCP